MPRKGTVELARRSVVRQTNLEISSVRETDAGRFTCLADGRRHEHSLSVVSVFVSVHPSAVLKLNDEATLQCEVKGQPQGCEVKWKSPNTKSPTNPSTVQLKPVTNSHNGAWECIVTCGSSTFSESLTITVQEPPTTTTPPITRKNITSFVTRSKGALLLAAQGEEGRNHQVAAEGRAIPPQDLPLTSRQGSS
ncbi:casein kinase II subunit alpha [Sarotherodon galilaeus]